MGLFSRFFGPAQRCSASGTVANASRREEATQLQAIMLWYLALLQNENGRVFRPDRHQTPLTPRLTRLTRRPKPRLENPQLACFTGAAVPTFFSIARFRSSARGESTSARAFSRKASRPPRWSTLLIALVETRRRTLRPSA